VALSTDEDDLFESCLSPSTFLWSLDDDVDDGRSATHEPYLEPLRLSADDADSSHSEAAVADPVGLQQPPSFQSSRHENATCTLTTRSHSPREQSTKDAVNRLNTNRSDHFVDDVTTVWEADGLLSETLSSVHISSDDSVAQSWLSSDLTTVTALSDSDSSCSVHSVRIEWKPVANGNDNEHCSLVETTLIPTNHAADVSTSCQHGSLECSYLSDDRTFLCDWKSGSEMDSDTDVDVTVPASVKAMSAVELRARLAKFGESPGPIVDSTRRLHELRLSRLLAGHDRQRLTAGNGHSTG